LDNKNTSKVSEGNCVFQPWLPVFNALFNINKNIVRIKTGETVLEGSSEAKAVFYSKQTHIIGFKVDIHILVDVEEEQIDSVCGEGCLKMAEDEKGLSDKSKLLREGKETQMAVQKLYNSAENKQTQG
jgi:hypothetical protein